MSETFLRLSLSTLNDNGNVPEDVDWWGIDRDYDFPITVQDDQVFVLSGNREDPSNEGLIDKDSIKGKAIWIF